MLLPLVIRWAKIPVDTTEEDEINEAVRTIIAESFDSVAEIGQEIGAPPVSYTHLDVYKRQAPSRRLWGIDHRGLGGALPAGAP